jgi:hypothetical protein
MPIAVNAKSRTSRALHLLSAHFPVHLPSWMSMSASLFAFTGLRTVRPQQARRRAHGTQPDTGEPGSPAATAYRKAWFSGGTGYRGTWCRTPQAESGFPRFPELRGHGNGHDSDMTQSDRILTAREQGADCMMLYAMGACDMDCTGLSCVPGDGAELQ